MARLTNAELAYMKLRVKEIRDSAIRRLEIIYTKKGEVVSDAAKLNAIIDGDVELPYASRKWSWSTKKKTELLDKRLREAFDFSDLECQESLDDCEAYRESMKVLRKKYGKALDVIVLKDREEANSAFEAFKLKWEGDLL